MNTFTYSGIKVMMYDGKGVEKDGEEEKIMYGIKKIEIDTNIYKTELVDCAEEKDIYKWELFDVKWLDVQTKRIITKERKFLDDDLVNLMKLVVKMEEFHRETIPNMIITAHEIHRLME